MSVRSREIREAVKKWGYSWSLDFDNRERSTLSAEDTQLVVKAALDYADTLDAATEPNENTDDH